MRVSLTGNNRGIIAAVLGIAVGLVSGCGTLSGVVRPQSALLVAASPRSAEVASPANPTEPPAGLADFDVPIPNVVSAATSASLSAPLDSAARDAAVMAQVRAPEPAAEPVETDEYDPWEPFNEKMFEFNRNLDRYVLKPVAKAYNVVMPGPFQVMISNGFDNISFVPRFVNSALQGKWGGAGRELSRFLINSTAGIGGLFDPAKDYWGIQKSREDFGQTLAVWGASSGPYLILPFFEPLTVRDGIGKFVDTFMDPLSYYLPLFWDRLGMKVGDVVNERALNLDLYQGFEESVIDMYSAVRHGYLQRRERLIRE